MQAVLLKSGGSLGARLVTQDLSRTLQIDLPDSLFQVHTFLSRLQLEGRSVNTLGSPFSPGAVNDNVFSHILHPKAKAKSKIEAYMHFLQDYRYVCKLNTFVSPIMSKSLAALIS